MPNTLAHLGIQALATRGLLRDADLRWIFLGCVIPDMPWIAQRVLRAITAVDRLDLRLYAVVQSSLAFCVLLAMALALLSQRCGRNFLILALGSLLHLLLDAAQIKWANGINLLAPLDWKLTQYGHFWPEQWPSWFLTGLGIVYVLSHGRGTLRAPLGLMMPCWSRWGVSAMLLLCYMLGPLLFIHAPAALDSHFVRTLREVEQRPGRYLEVDRAWFEPTADGGRLNIFTGETLRLSGTLPDHPTQLSVRGHFRDATTLVVDSYRAHGTQRAPLSMLGLAIVALFWGVGLWHQWCCWRGVSNVRAAAIKEQV